MFLVSKQISSLRNVDIHLDILVSEWESDLAPPLKVS